MRYIPHTETDIQEMLSAIGVKEIGALFQSIPEALRLEAEVKVEAKECQEKKVEQAEKLE